MGFKRLSCKMQSGLICCQLQWMIRGIKITPYFAELKVRIVIVILYDYEGLKCHCL